MLTLGSAYLRALRASIGEQNPGPRTCSVSVLQLFFFKLRFFLVRMLDVGLTWSA